MSRLPLPTLLSQALVAFTIEVDNEFEHVIPHRTARTPPAERSRGPWLTSMVMWFNCMRFVGDQQMTVGELQRRARTATNLDGMRRWGYIDVQANPDDTRAHPPRSALLVRSTRDGREAQSVWRPLPGIVERRWEVRFGAAQLAAVRASLERLVARCELDLPDCLPILGYGLWSAGPSRDGFPPKSAGSETTHALQLPVLLSRALLMFAIDFEAASRVSLAVFADIVRIVDDQGIRLRDLPRLSGVSKESIAMAMGVLEKSGLAVVVPHPEGAPGKVVRLTATGKRAKDEGARLLGSVEERWHTAFGPDVIRNLRQSLEPLVGEPTQTPLFRGIDPYPEGWRATVRKPQTLPHFPMVLHRGGYPDGS